MAIVLVWSRVVSLLKGVMQSDEGANAVRRGELPTPSGSSRPMLLHEYRDTYPTLQCCILYRPVLAGIHVTIVKKRRLIKNASSSYLARHDSKSLTFSLLFAALLEDHLHQNTLSVARCNEHLARAFSTQSRSRRSRPYKTSPIAGKW